MKVKYYQLLTSLFLFFNGWLFAEGEEASAPPVDQSFMQTIVMIAIAFLFFYIILWRPEQKRRKAMEQQRSALKKGDRVAAMGIIGTVVRVGDQTVILKMYDGNSKLEVYKAAVTEVLPENNEKKGDEEGKKVVSSTDDES